MLKNIPSQLTMTELLGESLLEVWQELCSAKIESRKFFKDKPLPVFDIYKDFLGLNRALRKQITQDRSDEFASIDIDEDYLGLELLAIY